MTDGEALAELTRRLLVLEEWRAGIDEWRGDSDTKHRWADNEINRLMRLFLDWQREQRGNQEALMVKLDHILEVVVGDTKTRIPRP